MAISIERDERFAAYEASVVWVDHPLAGSIVMTPQAPGLCEGAFPADPEVTIHVVTAHNPGRLLSPEQNDERHVRMVRAVVSTPAVHVWRAVGGDPKWEHTEECVALVGLDDEQARALGRSFEQEAIWSWTSSVLRLVECESGSITELGWRVEPWVGSPSGP